MTLTVSVNKALTKGPFTHIACIFTGRKRSLGQGNIFRSVCQEFCPQGGGGVGQCLLRGEGNGGDPPGRLLLRAVHILLECILVNLCHSVWGKVIFSEACVKNSVHGGSVPVPGGRGNGGDPPGRLLLRAVHILLECILVNLCHSVLENTNVR